MIRHTLQICTLGILFLVNGCTDHERTPAVPQVTGRDTIFSIPPQYPDSLVILRFADLDGDGWRDVVLGVRFALLPSKSAKNPDSVIIYRFDPALQEHKRIAVYADYGVSDIAIFSHRSIRQPIIAVTLNGGGSDPITFGKALLTLEDHSLHVRAYAPLGDPTLIEMDSLLVLELHDSYSGWLAHYRSVEYADSLLPVGQPATQSYPVLLEKRIAYYRAQLDSLWTVRRTLTTDDQYRIVTSAILSVANLTAKRSGTAIGQRTLRQLRWQWNAILPDEYRQLLDEFAEDLANGFAFAPR
ncbi:MAG: hypothetical protein KatS3mg039_0490 [Candidatus Kapaibacterium sp.]|nr:MAG: hypothetical protein KatS3mg039_0490 [Candidatus Kapabacteria bacterium]